MDLINYWRVDMHNYASTSTTFEPSLYGSCTVTERKSEVARELGAMSCGLGWGDVRLDSVKGMSNAEVKYMLKNCVWREVTKM